MEPSTHPDEGHRQWAESVASGSKWSPEEERLMDWIAKCDLDARGAGIQRMRIFVLVGIGLTVFSFIMFPVEPAIFVLVGTVGALACYVFGTSQNRSFQVIKKLMANGKKGEP